MNQSSVQIKKHSVCLVHDWLVTMRGGEKVLESLAIIYPNVPIYTLFLRREKLSPILQKREIHVSFLQFIPWVWKVYQWLLPLFPIAIRLLNVKNYDLVISSSHCVAKAVNVRKDAIHICYCHTPMRYLWGFSKEYLENLPVVLRQMIQFYFRYLKKWDVQTSKKVTTFIANSKNTATKISNLYGKETTVIYPPLDSLPEEANQVGTGQGDYFLLVSALVPYKRVDLAIEAFNRLKQPLKIVGDGPLRNHLQKMVEFHGIEFEGWLEQTELLKRYAQCRALIFPGEEDFGLVPLEAQMFGKAVIAFGKGGATETVLAYNEEGERRLINQCTGLFFYQQSADALIEQIGRFNGLQFDPLFIKTHARHFRKERFQQEIANFINTFYQTRLVSDAKKLVSSIP